MRRRGGVWRWPVPPARGASEGEPFRSRSAFRGDATATSTSLRRRHASANEMPEINAHVSIRSGSGNKPRPSGSRKKDISQRTDAWRKWQQRRSGGAPAAPDACLPAVPHRYLMGTASQSCKDPNGISRGPHSNLAGTTSGSHVDPIGISWGPHRDHWGPHGILWGPHWDLMVSPSGSDGDPFGIFWGPHRILRGAFTEKKMVLLRQQN